MDQSLWTELVSHTQHLDQYSGKQTSSQHPWRWLVTWKSQVSCTLWDWVLPFSFHVWHFCPIHAAVPYTLKRLGLNGPLHSKGKQDGNSPSQMLLAARGSGRCALQDTNGIGVRGRREDDLSCWHSYVRVWGVTGIAVSTKGHDAVIPLAKVARPANLCSAD